MSQDVRARLDAVRARIDAAAVRAGRDPGTILLVAVSKGVPAQRISGGLFTDLGENRVAELLDKQAELPDPGLRWHFIGRLQRNKAASIAGRVALIHSVDSGQLAETIARAAVAREVTQDVLVQVNTSHERTKGGVAPQDALELALSVARLEGLSLRGFMTMAPPDDLEGSRACFRTLRSIRDDAPEVIESAGMLSMGMTGDFEVAVEEGATIVRVGTAIFGARTVA